MFSAAFAVPRSKSAILGPLQGWLTDHLGPRALVRAGLVIFAAGFVLFIVMGGMVGRGSALLLLATASACWMVVGFAILHGLMLGMMAGPLVAGILADRTGSYRPGFTGLATLALSPSCSPGARRRPCASPPAGRRRPCPDRSRQPAPGPGFPRAESSRSS
jgi:MFS family permease